MKQQTQLCWGCQNACGGCDWSRALKPVDGWTAEYLPRRYSKAGYVLSEGYFITECPKFMPDEVVETVKVGRPGNFNDKISKLFAQIDELGKRQEKFIKKGIKQDGRH